MSYKGPTCTSCGGAGGHTETTVNEDGTTISVWRSCTTCGGRGHS
jgi:DnaJ-class molecular chaperone